MNGFNIEIEYSDKTKGTVLEVWPGNLVKVIAPNGLSESELKSLISKKTKWIIEKQRLIKDIPAWREREFVSGESFPVLGQEYRLKIIEGYGQAVLNDGRLIVPVPHFDLEDDDKADFIKLSLVNWYKAEALNKIKSKVDSFCEKIERKPSTISIKDYSGRWGSCTPSGDLIFNWQILSLPRECFDYVIAHEVCHLVELNHSKGFYRLLTSMMIESDALEIRLKYYKNLFEL